MAYSELIKNFNKVRDYMYEFYVYGLKRRDEYDAKSARSYDDVRRRIDSWLGEYMSSMQDSSGKNVFLSVDSRTVEQNPFYKAFKAKSFTNKDIMLHFHILDILHDGEKLTASEITELIAEQLFGFSDELMPDLSTVRKKLKEYAELGILHEEKRGKAKLYSIMRDGIDLNLWRNAIEFFSEAGQLGIIGSYLKDKECFAKPENGTNNSPIIRFKHHYIIEALNSEIMYECLLAISESRTLNIRNTGKRRRSEIEHVVFPFKIYVSTQSGRFYLCARDMSFGDITMMRLDHIKQISRGEVVEDTQKYLREYEKFTKYLWGVSTGNSGTIDEISFIVQVLPGQSYIVDRLYRERRICMIERVDEGSEKSGVLIYRVSAKLYDASEIIPWIRTFYGRIREFHCSNEEIERRFFDDLAEMQALYAELEVEEEQEFETKHDFEIKRNAELNRNCDGGDGRDI